MSTISVGKLRQNPTQMLREVAAGACYTITDRGRPIAEVRPVREIRWVPSEQFTELMKELGPDPKWAAELAAHRATQDMRDPWEDAR